MDERLSWSDRLALAGHLLVCHGCRNFRRQLRIMRNATRNLATCVDSLEEETGLSEASRARILQSMRDAAPKT